MFGNEYGFGFIRTGFEKSATEIYVITPILEETEIEIGVEYSMICAPQTVFQK